MIAVALFFVGAVVAQEAEPVSLATCASCSTNYSNCVTNNPNNWQSCYNTYTQCAQSCSWRNYQATSLASCTTCANVYQSCVTNNPSDW